MNAPSSGAITSSTAGDDLYYFFYDWEVASLSVFCEGPREEVIVSVGGMSVGENDRDQVSVWPNPADATLSISYANADDVFGIQLIDATGRIILDEIVTDGTATIMHLDVSGIAAGGYSLHIKMKDRSVIEHVILH